MTKKSNSFKNLITVLLALLLLGIAVAPASAAITTNITSTNITRGASTSTLQTFNVTFGAIGDANTGGVSLYLTGTGITFNTSAAALNGLDGISAVSDNTTRLPHGGLVTVVSSTQLTIALSSAVTDSANWTLSNIKLILTDQAVANTTFSVVGAAPNIKGTFDIVPLAPTVARGNGVANLSAGNSSQLLNANLNITSTSFSPKDLYQWINLTITAPAGVTFDQTKNSSITNTTLSNLSISTVRTANYSNSNKTVSLYINNTLQNVGNFINITGLYVNVPGSIVNGTSVVISVNTTPEGGFEIVANSTVYNFMVWTPRISYLQLNSNNNVTAGRNSQLLDSNLIINSTVANDLNVGTRINLTINTDGVSFNRSKNGSIVNDAANDGVDIATVLNTTNYSSNNKMVTLLISSSSNVVGDGINLSGLYVDVNSTLVNGTKVNISVSTIQVNGTEAPIVSTLYNFTVLTPTISSYPGSTNNTVAAGNPSNLLDSYLTVNSTVADDLIYGTRINLTIDSTESITFDRSKNGSIVNDTTGAVSISVVNTTNYSNGNKTVSLFVNGSTTNSVGAGINISGLYVAVPSTTANGTVVNITVSIFTVNGSSVQIVSTLYNFTVRNPVLSSRTSDVIFVDNLGVVNSSNVSVTNVSINAIGVNSTAREDVGNNTFINLSLESSGIFKFSNSWTGITSVNSGSLNVNVSGTSRNIADYAMRIPVVVSSNPGDWVSISGINLSAQGLSTVSAGNSTKYITVTTRPLNGTGDITLNTTIANITVVKMAPDVVANITANTSGMIGTQKTLVFNISNSTFSKTFGGAGVTFSVSNSAFTMTSSTGTTDANGNVSVEVTIPATSGINTTVTAYLTSNSSINDSILLDAIAGPATQLLVTHNGPQLKSNTLWDNNITVTVYALDAGGNRNTSVTNSVILTTSGTARVSNDSAVPMVAGVVSWNVSSINAETITLTATTSGLTAGVNTTFFSEPITEIIVTATPSSITANGSITTLHAQLIGSSGNVTVSGINVTFESLNTTLANVTATGTTGAEGYAEVNLTSNSLNAVGTVQVQARANSKGGLVNVTIIAIPALDSITLADASVVAGSNTTFPATTLDQYSNPITVILTWGSTNLTVGTINTSTGIFTANTTTGTTIITASNGSKYGSANVTVIAGALNTITVTPSTANVISGATQTFTATGADAYGNAVNVTPTWESSNETVGDIDDITGVFTAVVAGTTNITASNGSVVSANVIVTVTAGALNSISVSPSTADVASGTTQNFTATGLDANGNVVSSLTPTWNVSNESVGTITSEGVFTGLAVGTTNITASNGSVVSENAIVTVTAGALASITVTPDEVELTAGATQTFTATGADAYGNAVIPTVTWESSNETVGDINDSTGVFTALEAGTSTITATSGDVSGTATVTVTAGTTDIMAYYRGLTGSPTVVDTADLLQAADDWSNDVTPSGFTEPITTAQLLELANEWSSS